MEIVSCLMLDCCLLFHTKTETTQVYIQLLYDIGIIQDKYINRLKKILDIVAQNG